MEIVNCFDNRSTNASAEYFNAKVKAFRAQFRGVRDIPDQAVIFVGRLKDYYLCAMELMDQAVILVGRLKDYYLYLWKLWITLRIAVRMRVRRVSMQKLKHSVHSFEV